MSIFAHNPNRKGPLRYVQLGVCYGLLILLAFFFFFPLLFMFVSAFKNEAQLLSDMGKITAFLPVGTLSLDNFRAVFERTGYLLGFINSICIVGITVLLGVFVNSMFAYALARFRFVGRDTLLSAVIALIIVPFEAVAVPLLLVVNKLPWFDFDLNINTEDVHGILDIFKLKMDPVYNGLVSGWMDSYHVQIFPFIAHAFSIYLFYQFFIELPKDLEEAALLDGAGRFRIYWSIVLPLSRPVIATVATLQFLARWADLLWPVMVVRGDEYATLPYLMQTFFGQMPREWGPIMAFAAMTTLPTLLLFIVFQRWFVRSVVSSAIKG